MHEQLQAKIKLYEAVLELLPGMYEGQPELLAARILFWEGQMTDAEEKLYNRTHGDSIPSQALVKQWGLE